MPLSELLREGAIESFLMIIHQFQILQMLAVMLMLMLEFKRTRAYISAGSQAIVSLILEKELTSIPLSLVAEEVSSV